MCTIINPTPLYGIIAFAVVFSSLSVYASFKWTAYKKSRATQAD